MKPPSCSRLGRLRLAFSAALFAATSVSFAQPPQVLVFDGGSNDRASAVATDASGSVFVAGMSTSSVNPSGFSVIKYNALGSLQWLARPTGLVDYNATLASDVATDAAGNVYAVGYAMKPLPFFQNDLGGVITSFNGAGAQRWVQLFNGPDNSHDALRAVAVDTHGVYVTGVTTGAWGRADWITIKYSLAGVEQWRQIEVGAGNTDDQPVALKLDEPGNVVVLGWVQPTGVSGPKDARIVKRDAQGNLLWRADYSGTELSDEFPTDLAIDAAGNIYVTLDRGVSTNPELPSVPVTIKYNANGSRLFVLEGSGRGGSAVELDASGNFIVSGVSLDDAGSNPLPRTSKFTPDGNLLWSTPVATLHLAVDDVTGSVYLTSGYLGFSAMKLNSAGQLLWEHTIAEGKSVNDAMVDEATGDFILTGNSDLGHGNIITARFAAGSVPTPPVLVPVAPSNLVASAKKGSVTLTWLDNSNNETGFQIERATGGGAFSQIAQVGANVKSFTSSGLAKNQSYAFRVRASNTGGNSGYSNTVTAVAR